MQPWMFRRAMRLCALAGVLAAPALARGGEPVPTGRPPSVPLVTHDPYFSVWSAADRLTDETTRHWTRAPQPLASLVRVDGKPFRLMGDQPEDVPALEQKALEVTPTRTTYRFGNEAVSIDLTFLSPLLPADLDLMSRPVTYLTWTVASADGKPHEVELLLTASALLAVNEPGPVVAGREGKAGPLGWVRVGTLDQPVLERRGDGVRIDWGHLYLAADPARWTLATADAKDLLARFAGHGELAAYAPTAQAAATADGPALAALAKLGPVGAEPVAATALLAYDDRYSINFMEEWLRPYWARSGATILDVLAAAAREQADVTRRAAEFDATLVADLDRLGGPAYVRIGSLAHRQSIAGGKLAADSNGMPLYFSKENTSNGCIGTADVFYPQLPHFLLMNPALAEASLEPMLAYASSPRWKFPFAPHDLGTYPQATGQVYGGGERTTENQMPVEESGNMLLLVAAAARARGNADQASRYWPALTKWAEYCEREGFDPANQLCTDDFAGHLARNVNLSAKAILGLAAYGQLAAMRGDAATAEKATTTARALARKWVEMADAGDHTRLTFDPGDTWSLKYNLIWDKVLGLEIFPPEVAAKELAFYPTVANKYGVPLDSRKAFTKGDWLVWTASLAPDRATFEAFIAPLDRFTQETPDRLPFSDWHWTDSGKFAGFYARPVIGGVFIRLLTEPETWKRWAAKAPKVEGTWAPLPVPPPVTTLLPAATEKPATWRYALDEPAGDWAAPGFDDAAWKEGPGGFGTAQTPSSVIGTTWDTKAIWLRRRFDLPPVPPAERATLRLLLHHDEDAEVYLNGVLAARRRGYSTGYQLVRIRPEAAATLRLSGNVLAIRCRQTDGGQYIDAGLVAVEAKGRERGDGGR